MAFHKGNGGKITVGATDLNITSWTMTKEVELANVTNSNSSGWQQVLPTVKKASGTVSVSWDSDNIPDTDVTLDIGDSATLKLYMGDSGKFYQVTVYVKSNVPTVNNQGDVVKMDISWESTGAVTDPIT